MGRGWQPLSGEICHRQLVAKEARGRRAREEERRTKDDSCLGGNSLCVCLEVAGIVVVCSRRSRSQSLLLGWQPATAHVYPPPVTSSAVSFGGCLLH